MEVEDSTADPPAACNTTDESVTELKADDLFNCSICYERLDKAKILCCLHHFCQLCLEKHYGLGMPRSKIKQFKVISCPHCREMTVMSRGIDGLPIDPSLAKMTWLLGVVNSCLKEQEAKTEEDVDCRQDLETLLEKTRDTIATIHEKMLKLAQVELNNLTEPCSLPLGPKHKKARFAAIVKREEYNPLLARVKRLQDILYVANSSLKSFSSVTDEALSKFNQKDLEKVASVLTKIGEDILSEQTERLEQCENVYERLVCENETEGNFDSFSYKNLKVKLKWRIGQRGSSPGMFYWPVDVAFDDNRILVADKNNCRVQVFDLNGQFLEAIGKNELGPKRIAVNRGGTIHVSDELGQCVRMFNNSQSAGTWGEGQFSCPCGLAVDSQNDYIMSDAERGTVTVYSSQYSPTTVFKTKSPADTSAPNPYFVTTNECDQVIVSDSYNNCIKVFAKTGQLLLTFGRKLLACPRGVCLDKLGNILVVDSDHHKVRLFDGFGQFRRDILTCIDGLNSPMGIDMKDNLMVVTQCGFFGGHDVKMYVLDHD